MKESVTFISDGLKLQGNLAVPYEGVPCVVALHGLTGDKDEGMWPVVSSELYDSGYACFRFNFRSCGTGEERSEGEFEDIKLSNRIRDFKKSLDILEKKDVIDADRIGVVGLSLGGMVAIAARDDRTKAIVTLGSPYKIPRYDEPRIPEKSGDYYVLPSGERFKKDFYEDMKRYDLLEDVREAPPILIVQGGSDEIVPVEHAEILHESASEPKKLEIIEEADHVFTDGGSLNRAIDLIVEWFDEYL